MQNSLAQWFMVRVNSVYDESGKVEFKSNTPYSYSQHSIVVVYVEKDVSLKKDLKQKSNFVSVQKDYRDRWSFYTAIKLMEK